jgi:FkbM family methyltransferase
MFEWLDLTWPTRGGVHLRVANYEQWVIYNEVFVSGEYDRALGLMLDAPREARAPLHIVDVGAHAGYFTLRALDRLLERGVPLDSVTVTAFEASEALVRTYRARVLGANALAARVEIVHGLVGQPAGTAVLRDARVVSGEDAAGPRVPYVDLASHLAAVPRIDLLKCDIEGSEERLIANYPQVFARTMVATFELHRDWCDTGRCRRLLREYGFTHSATLREGEPFSVLTVWRP